MADKSVNNAKGYKDAPFQIYEMLLFEERIPHEIYIFSLIENQLHRNSRTLESKRLAFEYYFPKDNPMIPLLLLGEKVKYFKE